MNELRGNMVEAVQCLGDILSIQGIVLPSSTTPTRLVATTADGAVLRGEQTIDQGADRMTRARIVSLRHDPEATANPTAVQAILSADAVVIGPGDLFTSVLANVCIPGIREALLATPAQRIYVCNVMTKPGETAGYTTVDHVADVLSALGRDALDVVLASNSSLSSRSIAAYAGQGQHPVVFGSAEQLKRLTRAKILLANLSHETDLVRHDSARLAQTILSALPKHSFSHRYLFP
jgi:uncharacterized cofD-like protein